MIDQFEQETKTTFIRQSSLGGVVSLSEATNFSPRVLTTQPLTWGQTPKILAPNVYWLHSLESYGNFFLGQELIPFVRNNYCNCASCGKFRANEYFKRACKICKSRPHKRISDARK
jgi:hypothetical protein